MAPASEHSLVDHTVVVGDAVAAAVAVGGIAVAAAVAVVAAAVVHPTREHT